MLFYLLAARSEFGGLFGYTVQKAHMLLFFSVEVISFSILPQVTFFPPGGVGVTGWVFKKALFF